MRGCCAQSPALCPLQLDQAEGLPVGVDHPGRIKLMYGLVDVPCRSSSVQPGRRPTILSVSAATLVVESKGSGGRRDELEHPMRGT
jgi:hypothetical protein